MPLIQKSVSLKKAIVLEISNIEFTLAENVAADLCRELCEALGLRPVPIERADDAEPASPEPVAAAPPIFAPFLESPEDKAVAVFLRVSKDRPDWYAVASASGQSKLPAGEVRRILAERGIPVATRQKAHEATRGPIPVPITDAQIIESWKGYVAKGASAGNALRFTQKALRRRNEPTIPAERIRAVLKAAGLDAPEPLNRGGCHRHKEPAPAPPPAPGAEPRPEPLPEPLPRPAAIPPTEYAPTVPEGPGTDDTAFRRIWAEVEKTVIYVVATKGRAFTSMEREELVAEVRLKIWKGTDVIQGSAKAYAARMATNLCNDHRRNLSRRIQSLPSEFLVDSGDMFSANDFADSRPTPLEQITDEGRIAREAAESLKEPVRTAVLMRLDNSTYQEIADLQGVSTSVALKRVAKGANLLQKVVTEK